MSMARLVITAVVVEGRSKSEVARDYGVSRRWVQAWLPRYLAEGEAAFEPRSRRPQTSPQRTRRRSRTRSSRSARSWPGPGLDAGAETIALHLAAAPRQRRRRCRRSGGSCPDAGSSPRSRTSGPSARTCGSTPTSPTSAGRPTSPTGRSPTAPTSRSSTSSTTTPGCWLASTARRGLQSRRRGRRPARRPGRHGSPGSGCSPTTAPCSPAAPAAAAGSPSRLELAALGIGFSHSRPYHPQTCGKVERFHQTLKKWLARQDPAATTGELQAQLDTFRQLLQHHRPHRALGRRTPAQAWNARPRRQAVAPGHLVSRALPRPPRPHRHRRQAHPAPQQPPPPHRHRPPPRRHQRPRPRPRPRRPVITTTTANSSANSPSTPPATTRPSGLPPGVNYEPETPVKRCLETTQGGAEGI